MSTGFTLTLWGLVLAILDISLNGFDLLSDFLGYGRWRLAGASRELGIARVLAWVLILTLILRAQRELTA